MLPEINFRESSYREVYYRFCKGIWMSANESEIAAIVRVVDE